MRRRTRPGLTVYTGPMFGSKTSRMLAELERYDRMGLRVVAFKPKIDDRYSCDEIVTHSGLRRFAIAVENGPEIERLSENYDVIGIDESFMIPDSGESLIRLYLAGKTVVVSSIQLSATGNPFHELVQLFPWATRVEVCPAVCPITGHDAYFTVRKNDSSGSELQVGGSECYEPRAWPLPSFVGQRSNNEHED